MLLGGALLCGLRVVSLRRDEEIWKAKSKLTKQLEPLEANLGKLNLLKGLAKELKNLRADLESAESVWEVEGLQPRLRDMRVSINTEVARRKAWGEIIPLLST